VSTPGERRSYRYWRRRYASEKTNRALRLYLIAKAKLGRWDARYCAYNGVDPNVRDAVKRFLTRGYAAGLVPTSTTGGRHAPGSLHYERRAGDVGLRREEIGTPRGLRRMERFQRDEFRRGGHTELLGPINDLCVLRAHLSPLEEGTALEDQHDNHVHGGY
jgi:hypothetical protein